MFHWPFPLSTVEDTPESVLSPDIHVPLFPVVTRKLSVFRNMPVSFDMQSAISFLSCCCCPQEAMVVTTSKHPCLVPLFYFLPPGLACQALLTLSITVFHQTLPPLAGTTAPSNVYHCLLVSAITYHT